MVLSGNGRTLAIRQAYASEKSERADAYRQFVERRAREMGIEIPDNVKNPVLVRRVDDFGKMSAEEFAARSNKSQVAGMSVAEQAIADGRRILAADLLDYFFPDANGNVLASSNTDFVNAFLEQVGGSEMYRNSDGSIRSNLSPRIKAAVLAAMLDSDNRETVERLLDNPEGFNALVGGLMQSAANLAELSGKPEYDISEELSQAVELFVEMRNKGMKLADFSAQGDFFRAAPSDEVMFLMGLFEENAKTPSGISGVLRQYAGECKKIDTTTMDMFGTENPSKIEKLEQARDHYAADIAQQDANANLRGKYEEEGPTPEEIREAQRQKDEVKAKWTNPDGTMKKGYHCAPNGKPSRLSEEQWLWVRTPNFKRWFGDWESLAEAYPENEIFDIDEAYKFARKNLQGGSFTSKDGYGATLGREGIDKMNSGLARGKTANNRLHALAFANIGKLFGNSELLETEPPKDGNTNIKRYLKFYAPLYMDGLYAVKITVKELSGNNGNRLYSIEGLDITKESEYRGQSRGSKENSILADYSDSVNNFVKKLREVKENVSQVVDENGEPLVVYHGTNWKPLAEKAGEAVFKDESYFTASKTYANRYKKGAGEIYDFFLNIKKPFDTRNPKEREIFEKEFYGKWGNGAPLSERGLPDWTDGSDLWEFLQEKGYDYDSIVLDEGGDGGYGDSVSYRGESYVPLKPNQVKSATDNVGTFSENPDIRWSIREDSELDKIDRDFRELYDRYRGGEVSAEDLQKEIDDFMGDFHSERTPERKIIEYATPKEKIYDIDEAVDFVRKNLLNKPINNYVEQEGKIVSATISRNCLDKINSGKARGKTNNNRLYALAVANIDRLFTLSNRLESEPPKNGSPELKAVHRHYAPLLMDGKVYAVKLTVKEFDEKTGNRIYSIEGIDVNGESDLSGLSKNGENSDSSAAIQRSDSVKEFIDKIRNVNKKFHDLAREKISNKAYREAAKLVADYAKNKGYAVRVYHGTGADGFNVADATGKHFKNGEGAQAHGKGLYLALAKSTAENYRDAARDRPVDFDKVENDYGITPELLGVSRKDFDEIVTLFSEMGADETIEYYFNNKLNPIAEKLKAIIDDKGISTEDFRPTGRGKVFEWFTNLKKNEILYEDKRLSKQPAKVKKAVIEIMKEAGL